MTVSQLFLLFCSRSRTTKGETRQALFSNCVINFQNLVMDLFTLVPRTLIGVAYPAFATLKAVLSECTESSVAWLRYWVVLGVFSVVELLLDPLINPLKLAFPSYLILKCLFLAWCMAPVEWNGSDVIFNNVDNYLIISNYNSCSI